MRSFCGKWPPNSDEPTNKKLKLPGGYYEDTKQLQRVCAHLQKLIAEHFPYVACYVLNQLLLVKMFRKKAYCFAKETCLFSYKALDSQVKETCHSSLFYIICSKVFCIFINVPPVNCVLQALID